MFLGEAHKGPIKPEADHVGDHRARGRSLRQAAFIRANSDNSFRYVRIDANTLKQTLHARFCDRREKVLYVNVEDEPATQMRFGI
jgi:hypothetical protein